MEWDSWLHQYYITNLLCAMSNSGTQRYALHFLRGTWCCSRDIMWRCFKDRNKWHVKRMDASFKRTMMMAGQGSDAETMVVHQFFNTSSFRWWHSSSWGEYVCVCVSMCLCVCVIISMLVNIFSVSHSQCACTNVHTHRVVSTCIEPERFLLS